jgi:site-specific DNA recombinase
LVAPEILAAARARLTLNKRMATRTNAQPEAALLRGGYARCGYCGHAMRVRNEDRGTFYTCNTSSRDQHGCPFHVISAHILDQAVLDKLQLVLNRPELIGAEVARLRRDDPTKADREAVERRLGEVERLRGNLARRVAAIDDDDIAASLLAEMVALGKQPAALTSEREKLEAERASWEATQKQLLDLEDWCRSVPGNVNLLDYEGRRLAHMALMALGVESRVWSTDHTPRWEIKMLPDVLPVPISDLPTAGDGGLSWAHVDGYTRRGYARWRGRRGGRL